MTSGTGVMEKLIDYVSLAVSPANTSEEEWHDNLKHPRETR